MDTEKSHPMVQTSKPKNETADQQNENLQYNKQDMDQEQNVDLNPTLTNLQNIHFHLIGDARGYCGKITGTVFSEMNKLIAASATVLLFFGSDRDQPVHRTSCDSHGNFAIEELPPGFYTLVVEYGAGHSHRTPYIKVLPCQTVHQNIILKDCFIPVRR